MTARYLIRFDDLCPTMRWDVWEEIESALVNARVRPILAVVPDNRDEMLRVGPAHPRFWDDVRRWQERGWTIGLHGFQHRYVTEDAGIVGINDRSEFTGLPREEQERKLRRAVEIFREEGICPEVWVAPAHSFDVTTLSILMTFGIDVVSDGLSPYPFRDSRGMFWIPQQFWRFRPMPFGVWTICIHHNAWGHEHVARFRRDLLVYRDVIVGVQDVLARYGARRAGVLDAVSAPVLRAAIRARRAVRG